MSSVSSGNAGSSGSTKSEVTNITNVYEVDLSGVEDQLEELISSVSSGDLMIAETVSSGDALTYETLQQIEYGLEGVNERLGYAIGIALVFLLFGGIRLVYKHFSMFFQI